MLTCTTLNMEFNEVYSWLIQSENRKKIIVDFNQPLTATHIARRTDIALNACLHFLWGLTLYDILYCLNKGCRYNKLYWLTELGRACQRKLRESLALKQVMYCFPKINWNLFSSVCYSHRSAVIKAISRPLQAAEIKRKALSQNPKLRMSANNVRDVVQYLLSQGIVQKVKIGRRSHPRYELTELGEQLKELLVDVKFYIP